MLLISLLLAANELNAAYAADGYSRTSHGLGVLITTFGVGELSALNGVAGSMAERLPIVRPSPPSASPSLTPLLWQLHLVGVPSTSLQDKHAMLHHTLGDGKFTNFSDMSAHISAGVCLLKAGGRWTEEIDKVLTTCLTEVGTSAVALPCTD